MYSGSTTIVGKTTRYGNQSQQRERERERERKRKSSIEECADGIVVEFEFFPCSSSTNHDFQELDSKVTAVLGKAKYEYRGHGFLEQLQLLAEVYTR